METSKIRLFVGGLAGLILGNGPAQMILLGLAGIDLAAATVLAAIDGRLSARVLVTGAARKVLMFLALRAVDLASRLPGLPELPAGALVAGAFALHELISILEHCAKGFWAPPFVRAWLAVARKAADEEPATPAR